MPETSIILNGERRDIAGEVDLETLVNDLDLPSKRLAVELNGAVVRRTDWPQTKVSDGDRIEVVHFVGGG
ncbi:MAG TPA: sulfur carrier protein ThiS [Pyrinomonadaceae bacterium]|nr:sulfur carrier protein ThiS [Pyrinomonadaceae bacterium]